MDKLVSDCKATCELLENDIGMEEEFDSIMLEEMGFCETKDITAKGGFKMEKPLLHIDPKKIDLTPETFHNLNNKVSNQVNSSIKKHNLEKIRVKDKSDRATTELVLDRRTKAVLNKLINNERLFQISGCISTGKEANVYYAIGPSLSNNLNNIQQANHYKSKIKKLKTQNNIIKPLQPQEHQIDEGLQNEQIGEYAVKIYKTSILVFKDRDKYVEGEFRFRKGHCKSNPRKMVKLWAEKEMRNLKRIQLSDLKVPTPLLCKNNVLLMEFIGVDGVSAPLLKDIDNASDEDYKIFYEKICRIIRILYQACRLVHGDLSEYNILVFEGDLYLIDVSQSMEHDHPMALEFLRRDCYNVNKFFDNKGVKVLAMKKLFEFVVNNLISTTEEESATLSELLKERNELNHDQEMNLLLENKVFRETYIPRTLSEVDIDNSSLLSKNKELYQKMAGVQNIKQTPQNSIKEEINEETKNSSSEYGSESQSISEDDQDEDEDSTQKKKKFDPFEGLTKKERKQKVKEEKREKRKNKIPKHIKKKAQKKALKFRK